VRDLPGEADAFHEPAEFVAAEAAGEGPAASHDGDHGQDRASGGQLAWYGDSVYGTGDLRQAIAEAGQGLHETPAPRQARHHPGRHLAGTCLNLRYRGVPKNHAGLKRAALPR
jgi:hypothetical protein